MTTLIRKLQAIAIGTLSHHDKLFNEHGFRRIGADYLKGNVTHRYFGGTGKPTDVSGLSKKLRAQGYKYTKSKKGHTWVKAGHTVAFDNHTRDLTHAHRNPDSTYKAESSESGDDIASYAKAIISALEGDLTYPKIAIENAKAIIRAVSGKNADTGNANVGGKPTLK